MLEGFKIQSDVLRLIEDSKQDPLYHAAIEHDETFFPDTDFHLVRDNINTLLSGNTLRPFNVESIVEEIQAIVSNITLLDDHFEYSQLRIWALKTVKKIQDLIAENKKALGLVVPGSADNGDKENKDLGFVVMIYQIAVTYKKYPRKILDQYNRILIEHSEELPLQCIEAIYNNLPYITNGIESEQVTTGELNTFLMKLAIITDKCKEKFKWSSIASIYSGLRYADKSHTLGLNFHVLNQKIPQIEDKEEQVNSRFISDSMCILSKLEEDIVPDSFYKLLNNKMEESTDKFSEEVVVEILQNIEKNTTRIIPEYFYLTLAEKIQDSSRKFTPAGISYIIMKIYNILDDDIRMILLDAISEKLLSKDIQLTALQISYIFYQLRDSGSDIMSPKFLSAFAVQMNNCREQFRAFGLAGTLFGLQFLDPDKTPDFFLKVVQDKLFETNEILNIQIITMGIEGMVPFRKTERGKEIIVFLLFQLKSYKLEGLYENDLVTVVRALNLCELEVPDWIDVLYKDFLNYHKPKGNFTEKKAFNYFSKNYPELRIERNCFIDGIELDLNFTDFRVNLELDGGDHLPKKDQRRDYHLWRKRGIRTIRKPSNIASLKEVLEELEF